MRYAVFLLLGIQLAYATKHSLQYFDTAVSGDSDIAEFTVVGLLDGCEFMYFDSNTMKAVPKTEWIRRNEGADYWDSETQILISGHQVSRGNIQVAKERFNQSGGVHTVQRMYGCEWDDETGATDGFLQFGYDGEDFLTLDLKNLRYISPVQQGIITTQKLNNERAMLEYYKQYFNTVCVQWLKKYLDYEKSIQEKVSPTVSLIQRGSSSPVICYATSFYPCKVTITWMKNGQEHYEDVDLGELVPNEDGTFQKMSTLRVKPEEWRNNQFSCVVEHQGKTVTVDEIRTNNGDSVLIGIIVGVIAAVVLLIIAGVVGFKVYQKKKGFKPINTSDDGSSISSQTGA